MLDLNRMTKLIGFLFIVLGALPAVAEEKAPGPNSPRTGWSFTDAGLIPVQTGGRIKPLDSVAREAILAMTGSRSYQGWKAVDLIVSWIGNPVGWSEQPIVKNENIEVRRQLLVDEHRSYFSPAEMMQNTVFKQYAQE